MSQSARVFCLWEAMSPITHMAGVAGNESVVARQPVLTDRGVAHVPSLSANAIRHRCVREPGALHLIDAYGLAGKLTDLQLNFLLHGGSIVKGMTCGAENSRRVADMQRLFPLLRLLGGCLPDQVLAGSLLPSFGTLVCRENAPALTSLLPAGWATPEQALRPAEDFVSGYQYTRGDARKRLPDLPRVPDAVPADSNLMIFSGQAVTRGALFACAFTLQRAALTELGALLHGLSLWQASGGTIGGQGARGHGRLSMACRAEFGGVEVEDFAGPVGAYLAHVEASREEAMAWLESSFAKARPAKEKKGKGKAKDADTAGPEGDAA